VANCSVVLYHNNRATSKLAILNEKRENWIKTDMLSHMSYVEELWLWLWA